ncbi:MbtH family protein [Streptomyces sp. RerS4]|uniref:MbtH family protein n=1 Tax=Streptomyces sp. RerS4 TaxID=2942449 RepID=UPI00201BDD3D|nr:MbtH family protein [Streptomyces sp. RerS4]UQW99661.1 MbtH family protein [Streptomyces sp. RerS4]
MTTNPFESPDRSYLVLRNERAEHSIWPMGIDVPAGWDVVHDEDSRDACLAYIETQAA